MLVLESVSKTFGKTHAVQNVSLTVPAGQFVGVIGRSGAGKSTLLRMLNRLGEPTSGRILWKDSDVTALNGAELRDWRRRCAMIFQHFNLVGRLDVLNNVLLGRLAYTPTWRAALKAWTRDDRAMALAALDGLDIAMLAAQRADSSSESRSAARCCRNRRSCWRMSRWRRWTLAIPASSWTRCNGSTAISG